MASSRIRLSLGHRSQQAGLLVATANLPTTFQPTLMARSTVDQALVTGLSFASNQAVTTLTQEVLQALALLAIGRASLRHPREGEWSRAALVADLAAMAAGVAVQRAFRGKRREPLPRAALRTGGFWLTAAGGAGAAIGVLQEALGRRERAVTLPAVVPAATVLTALSAARHRRAALGEQHHEPARPLGEQLALGLAVSAACTGLAAGEARAAHAIGHVLAAVLPGNEVIWRPAGHLVTFGALALGLKVAIDRVFRTIESHEISVEASFDIPPLRSELTGSLESGVDFESLGKQGRRFVWSVTPPQVIAEVMGEAASRHPVRVYVGLESAPSEAERVALLMTELERTGAFEREWLMLASPTGTGYVNYEAVSALELLARGNCATAAMQYAERPSVLSLDRVSQGHHQLKLLLHALSERLREIPEGSRPRVVLFGESLGAWTSQDAVLDRGTHGLEELGIDDAVWIGSPHFSKWKEQVLYDDRPDVDPSLVGVFDNIDELRALPEAERKRLRYVMITHDNDGVALFGLELLFQAPPWLGPPASRPRRVPKSMRWFPNTTFFQVFVDMKNSAKVVPGVLAATGHDYRADLVPFFHTVLGLDATAEQLTRIGERLARDELARSQWTKRHGNAGTSMAAAVVRQWMVEHPDDVEQVLGPRLARIAGTDAESEPGTES